MHKLIIVVNVIVLACSVAGCAKEVHENQRPDRPDWIDKPEPNFVGRCSSQSKTAIEQENCAYKEGLAYLARSKDYAMDASSDITMEQALDDKNNMQNSTPGGTVIDKWFDEMANVLYVLIRENERP